MKHVISIGVSLSVILCFVLHCWVGSYKTCITYVISATVWIFYQCAAHSTRGR